MNELLQNLLELQALVFGETTEKNVESKKAELRAKIPEQILGHFDRLVVRGKKGVAIVRNQVCTGCYMKQPIGTINTLMQGQDIQLCDTCGRYLALPGPEEAQPEPAAAEAPKPTKAAKQPAKPRKRKAPVHANA